MLKKFAMLLSFMAKKKKKEIGCLNRWGGGCVVKEWNYQIHLVYAAREHFPPLYSYSHQFSFRGVTTGMTETLVLGDVNEMLACDNVFDEKNPRRCGILRFINKEKEDERILGRILGPKERPVCEPFFSVSLFVDEDTYKILYQAFSTRLASNQAVYLMFDIEHQRQNEPGFWEKAWQEELDISECRVHLGGEVEVPEYVIMGDAVTKKQWSLRESNRNTKRFVVLSIFFLVLFATLLEQAHTPWWEIAFISISIFVLLMAFTEC